MRRRAILLCLVLLLAGCTGTTGDVTGRTNGSTATTTAPAAETDSRPSPTATTTRTATPTVATKDPRWSRTETEAETGTPASTATTTSKSTTFPTSTATPTPSDTPASEPPAVNRSEFGRLFAETVRRNNVSVDGSEYDGARLVLRYDVRTSNETVARARINLIAVLYASIVNDTTGYAPTGLRIVPVVRDEATAPLDVETDWARSFNSGDLSPEEYVARMYESRD